VVFASSGAVSAAAIASSGAVSVAAFASSGAGSPLQGTGRAGACRRGTGESTFSSVREGGGCEGACGAARDGVSVR
jgi:hypothetical protein